IVIKEADDYQTDVSILCSNFLKKDLSGVQELLNKILLNESTYINFSGDDQLLIDQRKQVVLFAKSIASLINYLYTNNTNSLERALEIQTDLMELLQLEDEPSMWWVVRLFRIITNGFSQSSLWSNIPPKFKKKKNKKTAKNFITNLIFG